MDLSGPPGFNRTRKSLANQLINVPTNLSVLSQIIPVDKKVPEVIICYAAKE